MEKPQILNLHLHQTIGYPHLIENIEGKVDQLYLKTFETIENKPVGTDSIIALKAILTSEIIYVEPIEAAFRLFTDDHEAKIKLGKSSYLFYQLPYVPTTGKEILPLVTKFASSLSFNKEKNVYLFIRLYKEGPAKFVVQFIAPSASKEE
jgi:hypothetical protein